MPPVTPVSRCMEQNEPTFLCDQLHYATRLFNLPLGVFAEVPCANDERDLRDTAFAEDFAVAEWEEVKDGCGVCLAAG